MTAAIYARYSDPHQREASIEDQIRVCTEYAKREGLVVRHVYHDKAITGAVRARPGYLQMLEDATAKLFDVLLIHDLSRLSREDYELQGTLRRLRWNGIRIVGTTEGYDSNKTGHKLHAGVKGIMNEMHLDDIRAWTRKGMAGKASKGYSCGGRTYGYTNIPIEDPSGRKESYGRTAILAVRYAINPEQADIVRQIYAWFAAGYSYKWIAAELNRRQLPSSRGGSWVASAVKVILDNPMYEGKLQWNRSEWTRHPESGKRTYRRRPREEWVCVEKSELRLIDEDIVAQVRRRQRDNLDHHRRYGNPRQVRRYLFSGLMTCAECGGNMVLVAKGRYGCATFHTRSKLICSNGVTVSRLIVEDRLLARVKQQLLKPESVKRFIDAATALLKSRDDENAIGRVEQQVQAAQRVQKNILDAIKAGIVTATTKAALDEAETDIRRLEGLLLQLGQSSAEAALPKAAERYRHLVHSLEDQLTQHVDQARQILGILLGGTIRIHRVGEHLEAELSQSVRAVLAKCLNVEFDLGGCGGAQRGESIFVSLAPTLADSAPLKYRSGV